MITFKPITRDEHIEMKVIFRRLAKRISQPDPSLPR
jgi:hypothetical protein